MGWPKGLSDKEATRIIDGLRAGQSLTKFAFALLVSKPIATLIPNTAKRPFRWWSLTAQQPDAFTAFAHGWSKHTARMGISCHGRDLRPALAIGIVRAKCATSNISESLCRSR